MSDSISRAFAMHGVESLRPMIMGTRHMAVAGHYGAAHAAFAVLEAGGNAVDAGVAGGIALGVLQSDLVNVAGVAPILVYRADTHEVVTISGLGTWPRAVTRWLNSASRNRMPSSTVLSAIAGAQRTGSPWNRS